MKVDKKKFILKCAERIMNPVDVAKVAGISVETIYKITSGDGNITAKTLGKVAKALETSPSDLIAE